MREPSNRVKANIEPLHKVRYGNNPDAGRFLQVGDARIYYEVYGDGPPVALLHGGLFGYIDEFSTLIPMLADSYMVIAIALRGHVKSETGERRFSHRLFAEDSAAVIRHVTKKPVHLVGFSSGAIASYYLTLRHRNMVKKLVAVGATIATKEVAPATPEKEEPFPTPEELEKMAPKLVARRRKLYADPLDWDRLVKRFGDMSPDPDIPRTRIRSLTCPTLVMAGDRDDEITSEDLLETYRALPRGQLAIVPNSGHTVFKQRPAVTNALILEFLRE
jgi:pimeloyl-ACP methyl ester carboxylesterase